MNGPSRPIIEGISDALIDVAQHLQANAEGIYFVRRVVSIHSPDPQIRELPLFQQWDWEAGSRQASESKYVMFFLVLRYLV